jgi:hypothetical protein
MPISLSGSLLITGSITTTGGITISGSILSASYSATSSFSNDFTVLGNLTVFGTQSVQYITSSQLNISDNVITVNVASPGVRFGGLSVFDSGSLSSEATASLFWDSQQNHWIYQRESGSTYDGGMLISGPRNAAGLGNESGTTACMLLVGQGGDHLTSSLVYHDSTKTCFYGTSLFISSSGNVGIGTCTPSQKLEVIGGEIKAGRVDSSNEGGQLSFGRALDNNTSWYIDAYGNAASPQLRFVNVDNAVVAMTITGSNVGIGTNDPKTKLQINDSGAGAYTMLTIHNRQARAAGVGARINLLPNSDFTAGVDTGAAISAVNSSGNVNNDTNLIFETSNVGTGSEKMRITSCGAVKIGTGGTEDANGLHIRKTGNHLLLQNSNNSNYWNFDINSNNLLYIINNNNIGLLIDNSGIVMVGTSNTNPAENNVKGVAWYQDGRQFISSDNNEVMRINRKTSDGVLVFFHQDGTAEGNISVSGTTVSYNGGHLSRYSQTETYQRIEGLLKGTVMSNLDKMAEWIDPKTGEPYANEQLNCMKISDVEGDVNVAGVFVNWDDDDKSFTSDMNIAMTGDMIIRIAQNVVVEKGQLLMSAGDGTAKPQEDDIVRSKTIAKVTSNHITCVYEDGSYCVPCVLMAC